MSRRFPFPLLALALAATVVAVVGAHVLLDSNDVPSASVAPEQRGEPVLAPDLEPVWSASEADESPGSERAVVDEGNRAEVTPRVEDELAQALWVSGFVRFPEGTPPGETVDVVADGKDFKNREQHRVRVGADGSFRVAFAPGTRTGRLKIEAQHLYLEPPREVKPSSSKAPVELSLALGGRIEGRLVPPPGAGPVALPKRVRVELEASAESFLEHHTVRRTAEVGPDLRFELNGIPAKGDKRLTCDPKAWVGIHRSQVSVAAGRTTALDLALEPGARVSGRCVDSSGAPVALVRVSLDGHSTIAPRSAVSNADGSFELRGIEPGTLAIEATKKGWLSLRHELGTLENGGAIEGLELRLDPGHGLSGKVQWNDGRPVEGASVRVVELARSGEGSFESWNGERTVKTGADGKFRVLGLGEGPFEVTASAAVEIEPDPKAKGLAAKRKGSGPTWRARLPRVAADSEIELRLEPGPGLEVTVSDDMGRPLRAFTLYVVDMEASEGFLRGSARHDVVTNDGSFLLEGLGAGSWLVSARADGHLPSSQVSVTISAETGRLQLVLNRSTRISGTVLDAAGRPAARVRVAARMSSEGMDASADDVEEGTLGRLGVDRTDTSGRFEIVRILGRVELVATSREAGQSEPLALVLAPGQELSGLVLRLRGPARIQGELHPSAGRIAGRRITLEGGGSGLYSDTETTTDPQGRFEFANVEPGEHLVIAELEDDVMAQLEAQADGPEEYRRLMKSRASATVFVAPGETAHVELGAPPAHAIRISGVVRRGATPIERADLEWSLVWASKPSEIGPEPPSKAKLADARRDKFATTDARGRFEVYFELPGTYECVLRRVGSSTEITRSVKVSNDGLRTVDFEFGTGRIGGRVIGPGGVPLEGVKVRLSRDRADSSSGADRIAGVTTTDENGAFAFDDLPPGTYSLLTRTLHSRRRGVDSLNAQARIDDLVLGEAARIESVVLRMEPAESR